MKFIKTLMISCLLFVGTELICSSKKQSSGSTASKNPSQSQPASGNAENSKEVDKLIESFTQDTNKIPKNFFSQLNKSQQSLKQITNYTKKNNMTLSQSQKSKIQQAVDQIKAIKEQADKSKQQGK